MIYDKTKYHSDGMFPRELAPFQGGVHIGFFLGWAVKNGRISSSFRSDCANDIARFQRGELTGPRLLEICGEALSSDELDAIGNAFAIDYYGSGKYFEDYAEIIAGTLPTAYHVADTLESFAATCSLIDRRFAEGDYSSTGDIKYQLLDAVAVELEPLGFKLKKSKAWYVRKQPAGSEVFSLFLSMDGVLVSAPFATVRNDQISDVFHQVSGVEPKYQKDYRTLSTNFRSKLRIGNASELTAAVQAIHTMFFEQALPFYEKCSTLHQIDTILNDNPQDRCPYVGAGYWERSAYGVIAAKLVARPGFEDLVGWYRDKITSSNDGVYLKRFDALLALLAG